MQEKLKSYRADAIPALALVLNASSLSFALDILSSIAGITLSKSDLLDIFTWYVCE